MAFNVGELVAYLRLDTTDFKEGMAKSQAQADRLDEKSVDVKVTADTAGAETKLAAVAASEDAVGRSSGGASRGMASTESAARKLADATAAASIAWERLYEVEHSGTAQTSTLLSARQALVKAERNLVDVQNEVDASNEKVAASGQKAGKGIGALWNAVILLGPALVPIAAGVAGLTVGFGAMGAAGVLAIVGISQAMTHGTDLGGQYSTMMATLKGDLTTLGATAAGGILAPFQSAVADLQSKMPDLNVVIGDFSAITGKAAGALVQGLVAAFLALAPLARDADVYILALSNRFAAMMSGPGVVAFGDYVRSVFPQVMQTITSLGDAVIHLVTALAPLGMGALSVLQVFSSVIAAIPVPVLSALAQAATAAYVAVSLFKLLSNPLANFGQKMIDAGVDADIAAAGVRGLTVAAGGVAAIIGVVILAYSAFAESQRANTQATNDFADALRQSNGVIDESVRQMEAKKLSDAGALAQADRLGISMTTVTDAALGNVPAMEKVKAVVDAANKASNEYTIANGYTGAAVQGLAGDANGLAKTLGISNEALQAAIEKNRLLAGATATATATTAPYTLAQELLAESIGSTVSAMVTATAGQQTVRDAAAAAAAKMYVEGDAAGMLKAQLDSLNGKAISAAQAQNAFDSSLVNMTATTSKSAQSINDMSKASVTLRGELNGQVTNLENVAEANRGAGASTDAVSAQMASMRQQIIDNAVAHGANRDAVIAYIDTLLAIPKTVTPTQIDVDTAAAKANIAAIQAQILAIHAAPIVIPVTANYSWQVQAALGNARAGITLNLPGHAGGGLITGPGTSTSDSILGVDTSGVPITRVSPNEFVVNAAATARNRALLEAINSGQSAGGTQMPPIYVQNPWTGEYLLAKTQAVAMSTINAASATSVGIGRQIGAAS